ncbi:helix-turn-helix transcriptional regulator [Viridibacillus sp. FSL R5-0468]|uniref:helix-turn-helix domain-containing protein n=1 Tax=Viridibacillus sp. FSL R5-0468 TaxID=2921640 RepID=UPI0030FBD847
MTATINTSLLESKMILRGYKTRKSFAKAIDISEHSVSNMLNGIYNPSFIVMNKIFATLELTPQEGTEIFFSNYLRKTKVIEKAQ